MNDNSHADVSKDAKRAALLKFQQLSEIAAQQDLDDSQIAQFNKANRFDTNFDVVIGSQYIEVGPRKVALRVEITAEHLQPWGITHGGLLAALAESAGSVASYLAAGAEPAVMGTSNHTDFLRPSVKGDVIVATATPEHLGRSTHLWRIEHKNEATGKMVALTQLKTAVVPNPKPKR